MKPHFKIVGDRESGNYKVYNLNNEEYDLFCEIKNNKRGLKEARRQIGEHLLDQGYELKSVFIHQCIKPGRDKNPMEHWAVEEFLNGVPIKSL